MSLTMLQDLLGGPRFTRPPSRRRPTAQPKYQPDQTVRALARSASRAQRPCRITHHQPADHRPTQASHKPQSCSDHQTASRRGILRTPALLMSLSSHVPSQPSSPGAHGCSPHRARAPTAAQSPSYRPRSPASRPRTRLSPCTDHTAGVDSARSWLLPSRTLLAQRPAPHRRAVCTMVITWSTASGRPGPQ